MSDSEQIAIPRAVLRDLLVRKGALEPWDRRPCRGAMVSDIDLLALRDALGRMGWLTREWEVERYLADGAQISPFVPSLCIAEPLSGVLRPRKFHGLAVWQSAAAVHSGGLLDLFGIPRPGSWKPGGSTHRDCRHPARSDATAARTAGR